MKKTTRIAVAAITVASVGGMRAAGAISGDDVIDDNDVDVAEVHDVDETPASEPSPESPASEPSVT